MFRSPVPSVNCKLFNFSECYISIHVPIAGNDQFGDINGNIIQTNQLSIPWLPSEVTVALSKINIPGAGTIAIDYKSAYLTTEGGLYIYCSTAGAAGVASLKWQVVDATIVIQRK